jgi:hypothetical protein
MKRIFLQRERAMCSTILFVTAALAGCGGGGDDSANQTALNSAIGLEAGTDAAVAAQPAYMDGQTLTAAEQPAPANQQTASMDGSLAEVAPADAVAGDLVPATPPETQPVADASPTQPASSTGTTSPGAGSTVEAVDAPADYLSADPRQNYSTIDALNLQVMDANVKPAAISESTGVLGSLGQPNFKRVADPDDSARKAYLVQIAAADPGGDTHRTELAWSSAQHGYSLGVTYWQAFRVRIGDNIKNASSDDEVILWQVHDNSGQSGLNPNMTLIATGGGNSASLVTKLKYSSTSSSMKANAIGRTVYNAPGYPSNKWITFVVQFKPHHTAGNGAFFKMWRDGQLVVNDNSPNDYNSGQDKDASKRSYQKLGMYHYYGSNWGSSEQRTAYHKGLITYVDNGKITETFMRQQIEAR